MVRRNGIAGGIVVERHVLVVGIRGEEIAHGIGRYRLRRTAVVHEAEVLPPKDESNVIRRLLIERSYTDVARGDGSTQDVFFPQIILLTVGLIDVGPCHEIEVEVSFSEDGTAAELSVVADGAPDLQTVDIGSTLGDDIDHGCQGHATIKRRGRPPKHLYLPDLFQTDGKVGTGHIGAVAVETVSVEHDEYFLLSGAVDTAHGDIHLFVTLYVGHAGYIENEEFFQMPCSTGADHVFRYQCDRHWHLVETFCLTGGGGDGGCRAILDTGDHVGKTYRVLWQRGVIGCCLQQFLGIGFGLLGVVLSQTAKGHQTIGALLECTLEVGQVVAEQCHGLIDAADVVILFCLLIHLTHIAFLGRGRDAAQHTYYI